jgi:hypothetical protein
MVDGLYCIAVCIRQVGERMAKINQIANRCPKTNLSFVVLPEDKE